MNLASISTTKRLLFCILLDVVGTLSYSLPVLGELSDIIWAPIAAILYRKLFSGAGGWLGAGVVFLEELLPFSDVIPTFTLSWIVTNVFSIQPRTLNKSA